MALFHTAQDSKKLSQRNDQGLSPRWPLQRTNERDEKRQSETIEAASGKLLNVWIRLDGSAQVSLTAFMRRQRPAQKSKSDR
jgi:hypothetical protein